MPMYPSTCDIYRPFDSGTLVQAGVACRLLPDLASGQGAAGPFAWSHCIEVDAATDIRDGCTRTRDIPAVNYADGDEIRIGGTRYVVVWVEPHDRDGSLAFRRAYLLRHEVTWPDV